MLATALNERVSTKSNHDLAASLTLLQVDWDASKLESTLVIKEGFDELIDELQGKLASERSPDFAFCSISDPISQLSRRLWQAKRSDDIQHFLTHTLAIRIVSHVTLRKIARPA